MHVIKIYK